MIYRLVGGGILLLWSAAAGRLFTERQSAGYRVLDELIRLLEYIKRNIATFRTPIQSILQTYSSDILDDCGFTEIMRSRGLEAALDCGTLDIPREGKRLLQEFSERLGSDYTENEIKRCDYYIDLLREVSSREKERLSKNERLYKYLPPLAVLSLIIVIL